LVEIRTHDDPDALASRVADELDKRHRWRWRLLTAWILVFSAAAIFLYTANRSRIADIQKSRVESCQRSSEGIRTVLLPLFPAKNVRTTQQAETLSRFNEAINELKAKCVTQVKLR
jgi:hypothetical protein